MTAGRGRIAWTLIGLEVALAVAALGGALALVASPRDAMPAEYLARTPFSSWVWPGVLLGLTVGVPAAVVAGGALGRRVWAQPGHPLVGVALVGWIVVQVAVIGFTSWLQPAMFGWGIAILSLGVTNYRDGRTGQRVPRAVARLREPGRRQRC